jgi:hypothetical protein
MSDFFAQLMDRSSGMAEVLRPACPSFFEPVAPQFSAATDRFPLTRNLERRVDDDLAFDTARQSHGTRDSNRSSTSVELLSERKRKDSVEHFEGIKPSAEQMTVGAELEKGPPSLRVKYPSLDAKPETEPVEARKVSSHTEESTLLTREIHRQSPLLRETEVRSIAGVPAEAVAERFPPPASSRDDLSQAAVEQFSHLPAHVSLASLEDQKPVLVAGGGIESAVSLARSFSLKPLAPLEGNSKHKPADAENRDSSPSVHVTIGRVEVRASVFERPRRKGRETSPVMSLQDYLNRQANGAGR